MKKFFYFSALFINILSHTPAMAAHGVFFCTRDLHPNIYDQVGKTVTASAIFAASSSLSYCGLPASSATTVKIGAATIAGGAVSLLSSDYIYDLYKNGFLNIAKEAVAASMGSANTLSSVTPTENFVKVQIRDLNNNDVSMYRHCSLLVGNYRTTSETENVELGRHYTYGFFQDQNDPSGTGALDTNDPLHFSTICTKVKDVESADYRRMNVEIGDYYHDAVREGYSTSSHNCCTVAYAAVKQIGGDTAAIDSSNFNHKIGIEKGCLSFMVQSTEYLYNVARSSKSSSKDPDKKEEL